MGMSCVSGIHTLKESRPPILDRPQRQAPVERGLLFKSALVDIRDNRCNRVDSELSRETAPMPFHEIVLGRVGMWCRHVGRRAIPVDARHVHLFTAGDSHRVSHPIGCGDRNTGIAVEPRTLVSIARYVDDSATVESPFAQKHMTTNHRVIAAHRVLIAATRATAACVLEPLAVEELALRLVERVLRGHSRTVPHPESLTHRQHELVECARAALHKDFATRLSLQEVADEVGCSAFHLSRIFADATGSSLMKYRVTLRLGTAIGMIVDSTRPLVDIAAATGFADRSHLTRLLRRELGLSPRCLRLSVSAAEHLEIARRLLSDEPSSQLEDKAGRLFGADRRKIVHAR